jgi:tight adherence protein B
VSSSQLILGILLGITIFVGIFVVMGGADDGDSAGVLGRLNDMKASMAKDVNSSSFEAEARVPTGTALRETINKMGGSKVDKSARGNKMATKLLAAGIKMRPAEWLITSLGAGVLVGFLGYLRYGSPIALGIGCILGYGAAQLYLKRQLSKRRKEFSEQLGPAILSVSNGVKAGYTFAQAIDLVGKNAPAPIGPELMRVTRETQLGVPIQEALAHMVARNESEDLKLMLTAVQIQQQVGGNLAGILDSIEFTIRERVRIKGEIRTLTGQARASGWILIILPFALGGLLQLIAPTYFGPMMHSLPGQVMLGMAVFALACGYGIIQKIVNVKI